MKNFFKKKSYGGESRLKKVLKECHNESEKSFNISMRTVEILKESLYKSKREISKGIKDLDNYNINNSAIGNIAIELKKQLEAIELELQQDVDNTIQDIRIKRQHDYKFNITLFGKTRAGKSTLMHILTHDNEEAIGKGSERTTRDVRKYEWEGMTVTDVPGINAFEGEEDERIAEIAAKNADLIIFMITAGQPESSEADWLIKLKKEDKAIICLCNFKKGIGSPAILEKVIRNKDAFKKSMGLEGLKEQFNEFLRTELPNEHIEIYVASLLAQHYSMKPDYQKWENDLKELSQFDEFRDAVIAQISSRGIFYRRKSYLALIDAPIYRHYLKLMEFANNTYSASVTVNQKQREFQEWQREFNIYEKEALRKRIEQLFDQIRKSVSGFVEDNVENNDVKNRWENHMKKYNLQEKIKEALEISSGKCQTKINEIFKDLSADIKIDQRLNPFKNIPTSDIINWKRIHGWGSALAGVGSIVAFALASNPIGWVLAGVGALFGLFGWWSNSREKKLRDARERLYKSLMESLEKMETSTVRKAMDVFDKQICGEMQKSAFERLAIIKTTLLTVLNVEKRCGMTYCKQHSEISTQLVQNVIGYDKVNMTNQFLNIHKVARIPGKKIVIITREFLSAQTKRFISGWMGSNEFVETLYIRDDFSLVQQIAYLAKKYVPGIKFQYTELKSGESLIYMPKYSYTPTQLDGINLIQQILDIPIIFTNYIK